MELTESKVKCLLNVQNLNKLDNETFDQIMEIVLTHTYGKSDAEGILIRLAFYFFILLI